MSKATKIKSSRKKRPDILDRVTPLFARLGYNGVSMRDLAAAVGVTPAALYYHYKNKDELYIQAVSRAFDKKTNAAKIIMSNNQEPSKKLEVFIAWFVQSLNKDKDFRKLLQWAMLDNDSKRLKRLAKNSFQDLFEAIQNLGESFKQQYDPHLLTISIIGLVLYHSDNALIVKKPSTNSPLQDKADTTAQHIIALLENGLLPH